MKKKKPFELLELIFVDDSSKDGSLKIIHKIVKEKKWIKAFSLSKNYGHHPTTMAGILHTVGDWVVTMDEDLQHDPKYIEEMLCKAVKNSCDIVYAKPKKQVHNSAYRDWSSYLIKKIIVLCTDNKNANSFNSYRIIRGEIAREASKACGHETYFDIALGWFTESIQVFEMVLQDKRYIEEKKSGYNFSALLSHARRLLMSSKNRVLRFASFIGILSMLFSVAYILFILVLKYVFDYIIDVKGWASLVILITFFGGLTNFLIGILLEMISVIAQRSHGRPKFFEINRSNDQLIINYLNLNKHLP